MTTAVTDAFATCLSRIALNPTRVKLASDRYASVKGVIEAANPEFKVKQIGSFQRRTKVRPLDMRDGLDVDALVVIGEARATPMTASAPSRRRTASCVPSRRTRSTA